MNPRDPMLARAADLVLDKAESESSRFAQKKSAASGEWRTCCTSLRDDQNRGQRGLETGFSTRDMMKPAERPNGGSWPRASREKASARRPCSYAQWLPSWANSMWRRWLRPLRADVHVTGIYPQGERQVYRLTYPTVVRPNAARNIYGALIAPLGRASPSSRRRRSWSFSRAAVIAIECGWRLSQAHLVPSPCPPARTSRGPVAARSAAGDGSLSGTSLRFFDRLS